MGIARSWFNIEFRGVTSPTFIIKSFMNITVNQCYRPLSADFVGFLSPTGDDTWSRVPPEFPQDLDGSTVHDFEVRNGRYRTMDPESGIRTLDEQVISEKIAELTDSDRIDIELTGPVKVRLSLADEEGIWTLREETSFTNCSPAFPIMEVVFVYDRKEKILTLSLITTSRFWSCFSSTDSPDNNEWAKKSSDDMKLSLINTKYFLSYIKLLVESMRAVGVKSVWYEEPSSHPPDIGTIFRSEFAVTFGQPE